MGFISRPLGERRQESRTEGAYSTRYAQFGPFVLDRQQRDLSRNGSRVRLPGKVCEVLVALLERPGEIVTREELRGRLWGADTHVNYDANVNTTVNKLRQILGDSNEESVYVQTIPRQGYSFIGKVEFAGPSDSALKGEDSEASPALVPAVRGSGLFATHRSQAWFVAGVIALTIAAMLLGAAIALFSYRTF